MDNWYSGLAPDEVPYEKIEEMAENGEFHKWNYEAMDSQENGYEDVMSELKKYTAEDYIKLQTAKNECEKAGDTKKAAEYQAKMDSMVEEVYNIYRKKNVYPTLYFSEMGVMEEIERCIAYKAFWDGDTVSCVDGITEYFNGKQWKYISEYTDGEKVLQYNEDGTATLVDPIEYIHTENDDPFYLHSKFGGIGSCLTGNHDIVYRNLPENKMCKIKQSEILDIDFCGGVPINCVIEGGVDVSEDEIRSIYNHIKLGDLRVQEKVYSLSLKCRRELAKLIFPVKDDRWTHSFFISEFPEVADFVHSFMRLSGFYVERGIHKDFCKSRSLALFKSHRSHDGGFVKPYFVYDMYSINKRVGYTEIHDRHKYCFVVPSHMLVLRREGKIFVTGNCGAGIGTTLCKFLFPNLQDTPSKHDLEKKGAESIFAKFMNGQYLKRAIKFCFGYKNGCPVPTSVEGGLRLVGSAPSNFRPMNAKAVYERFCPEGGTIYDFCCGFGGRMLGALSSKKNFKYIGTDPNTETMYHLHELGEYIESVTGRDDSYELHCCGSEVFKGKPNSIDFAFSSPPYFDLEVYSDEPTQCYNKFPELESWLEGYVRQTIKNIYFMLKPGRVYAVNIADFKVKGNKEVAYVDEWIRISSEEGMPLFDTVYLGVTARAGSKEQAAGELKKENILIFKKPL